MSSSNEDVGAGVVLCVAVALVFFFGLFIGFLRGDTNGELRAQRQAIQYNHAHYDHDSGEFKWNNAPEKAP